MGKEPNKISDLKRRFAKAVATDLMVRLEMYVIDLAYAARNEPNDITASREALIDKVIELLDTDNAPNYVETIIKTGMTVDDA